MSIVVLYESVRYSNPSYLAPLACQDLFSIYDLERERESVCNNGTWDMIQISAQSDHHTFSPLSKVRRVKGVHLV